MLFVRIERPVLCLVLSFESRRLKRRHQASLHEMSHLKSFSSHCYCLLINWAFFRDKSSVHQERKDIVVCLRRYAPMLWSFDVQLVDHIASKRQRRKIFFFFFVVVVWHVRSDMFIDLRRRAKRDVEVFNSSHLSNAFWIGHPVGRRSMLELNWTKRITCLLNRLNDHFHTFEDENVRSQISSSIREAEGTYWLVIRLDPLISIEYLRLLMITGEDEVYETWMYSMSSCLTNWIWWTEVSWRKILIDLLVLSEKISVCESTRCLHQMSNEPVSV